MNVWRRSTTSPNPVLCPLPSCLPTPERPQLYTYITQESECFKIQVKSCVSSRLYLPHLHLPFQLNKMSFPTPDAESTSLAYIAHMSSCRHPHSSISTPSWCWVSMTLDRSIVERFSHVRLVIVYEEIPELVDLVSNMPVWSL